MLILFTAEPTLTLLAIYQERIYRYFQELTLSIFRKVCHKERFATREECYCVHKD